MSDFEVFKDFTFDSAHRLMKVPAGHKCGALHGHTWRVTVCVAGPVETGGDGPEWVVDYADIAAAWKPLHDRVDHKFLNEVLPFETTSENIARWIYDELRRGGLAVSRVVVRETCTAGCAYPAPR